MPLALWTERYAEPNTGIVAFAAGITPIRSCARSRAATSRPEAGVYRLYLGIYDWRTGFRSPIRDADNQPIADRLFIGEIQVRDRPRQ